MAGPTVGVTLVSFGQFESPWPAKAHKCSRSIDIPRPTVYLFVFAHTRPKGEGAGVSMGPFYGGLLFGIRG